MSSLVTYDALFSSELLLELMEEKSEQIKRYEFDNWTLRSALTQLRQESDESTRELASIKVSDSQTLTS